MDSETIKAIVIGAAGERLGGLAAGIVLAASKATMRKFQSKPIRRAVQYALEDAILSANETLPKKMSGVTRY